MKLDTTRALHTFTGEPIHDAAGPVALATVLVAALLASHADEQPSGEEKLWRYNLARRIQQAGGTVELSAEELALIRRLVGKGYATPVVGAVHEAIEGTRGPHVPH